MDETTIIENCIFLVARVLNDTEGENEKKAVTAALVELRRYRAEPKLFGKFFEFVRARKARGDLTFG